MPTSRLFWTPLSPRHRLRYTHDLLEWMYAEGRPEHWIQWTFWEWFIGCSHEQAVKDPRWKMHSIMADSADWNWVRFQRDVRVKLERLLEEHARTGERGGLTLRRQLSRPPGPDGLRFFFYGYVVEPPLTAKKVITYALEETLRYLDGLAVDALGRCPQCHRYFARLRAIRRQYCSPRCTWLASRARRPAPDHRARRRRSTKAKP